MRKDDDSPTTIKDTITTVQGVLNWAVEFELIDATPLPKYKKPAARCRTRVITRGEFGALLRHSDRNFQRFLMGLRLTGCRPGEFGASSGNGSTWTRNFGLSRNTKPSRGSESPGHG